MSIANTLWMEVEQEAQTTKRVLDRVPADKLGWKPHPKSFSLGQLALHIATVPGAIAAAATPDTFEAPGFVVCSFVPRPYDFHPDSVKVPYHHANVDSDEVLFYSAGEFASRAGSGLLPSITRPRPWT